ncbi:MAG TPA: hypothetical protein VMS63_05995 [Gaiellaceae bacterium]|nr:hypothetical protein [Gaiellaceae bacterium]
MSFDGVAGSAFELGEGSFEFVVGERFDLAALVADEVVMVFAVGMDGFEAGAVGAELDALEVAVAAELFECAVDAGDADSAALRSELVEDLLGGQAAGLFAEQLDDGAAGAAVAVSAASERGERLLRPFAAG